MEVPTFRDWTPLMKAADISPARKGSSEKYSKFLPHRGLRLMFTAGPRTTLSFSCWQLSPMAWPILLIRKRSKEAAVAQAAGIQTASMESFMPRWSASRSCLRRPWGPSETMQAGIPRRSTGLVCQKSRPDRRLHFSSRVIWETSALMSIIKTPLHMGRAERPSP